MFSPARLTLGPILIGTVFNAFVYGICLSQFITYWERMSSDRKPVRFLVNWVFCLDTFHTGALFHMLWVYNIDHFDDANFLLHALWPFSATPLVTTLTSYPIQIYLSWRIKRFSESNRVFVALLFLSSVQATLGILCCVEAFKHSDLTKYARLIPYVDAWQISAVVADGSLTVFLWYYLSRSRTEMPRSNNVITRVIHMSIETAAIGAFFCIMDLITFSKFGQTSIHVIFAFPMGRIYTNTLLLTLNSRSSLREEFTRTVLPELNFDELQSTTSRTSEPAELRRNHLLNWKSIRLSCFNFFRVSRGLLPQKTPMTDPEVSQEPEAVK